MGILYLIGNVPVYIPIICYIAGAILLLLEVLQPGFGVFGTTGALSISAGIVLRIISGATTLEIVFTLVAFIVFFVIVITLAVRSAKSGKLSKSPLILSQTAVSEGHTKGTPNYSDLLGKTGIAATFLRPVGQGEFDGIKVEVIARNPAVINAGCQIKIIEVSGQKIVVDKIDGGNNV